MIGVCEVGRNGVRSAGFIPCWIRPTGQPEPLGQDVLGASVASYVRNITRSAGLKNVSFEPEDGWVRFFRQT